MKHVGFKISMVYGPVRASVGDMIRKISPENKNLVGQLIFEDEDYIVDIHQCIDESIMMTLGRYQRRPLIGGSYSWQASP